MKRIIALLLMLLLTLTLAACEEGVPFESPPVSPADVSANLSDGSAPPTVPAGDSVLDQWQYRIATVDGEEIFATELRFQLATLLSTYVEYGGEVDWNGTIEGKPAALFFLDEAFRNILTFRAVERLSELNSVVLTDEEITQFENELASFTEEYGGIEGFTQLLAADGLTLDLYSYIATIPMLHEKLYEALFVTEDTRIDVTDDQVLQFFNAEFYTSRHIMVALYDEEGYMLDSALIEQQRAVIDEAYQRFEAGENFGDLMEEYSEDSLLNGSMTFFGDETIEEYRNVAVALQPGETSGVEEIAGTYIIIQRMPLDLSFLQEYLPDITEQYKKWAFAEQLAAVSDTMVVEFDDAFHAVDVQALYNEYMLLPD